MSGVEPGTGPESWPLTGGPKDSAMLKECSTRVHSNSVSSSTGLLLGVMSHFGRPRIGHLKSLPCVVLA